MNRNWCWKRWTVATFLRVFLQKLVNWVIIVLINIVFFYFFFLMIFVEKESKIQEIFEWKGYKSSIYTHIQTQISNNRIREKKIIKMKYWYLIYCADSTFLIFIKIFKFESFITAFNDLTCVSYVSTCEHFQAIYGIIWIYKAKTNNYDLLLSCVCVFCGLLLDVMCELVNEEEMEKIDTSHWLNRLIRAVQPLKWYEIDVAL